MLNEIDTNNFKKKLSYRGLDYTNDQVKGKIDTIKYNLSKIKKSVKNYDKKIVELNQ